MRMAELHISDVSRAVSDGTRDLVSQVQRLQQQINAMGNVQQAVSRISSHQQQLSEVVRQLQRINNQLLLLSQAVALSSKGSVSSAGDPRMLTLIRADINELKMRFVIFERFAEGISEYMREEFERRQQEHRENNTL